MTYKEKLKFHLTDKNDKPTGVYDYAIFQDIKSNYHIFICGGNPYIYEHGVYVLDMNGVRIKTIIRGYILETFIKSNTITRIYNLFLQDASLQKEFDEINNFKEYMINFKNKLYDATNGKMYDHFPGFLSINQIPHDYDPKNPPSKGEAIEKFLSYAVPDPEDREMLLQYIGLCCTTDTSQQKMLIITGLGGTGKSTLINLISKVVGNKNISNIALSDLEQRFSAIMLMGKTMNACADLEIDALEQTSMVKKLIGQDVIKGEYKGKDCVPFRNYAKLLFSTNELPIVRNEKTNGFYRRLLILKMSNQPPEVNTNLFSELEKEIDYLIHISMQALMRMYESGKIVDSKHSSDEKEQLNKDSDTIAAFLHEKCDTSDDSVCTERTELYKEYTDYCKENDRQAHTRNMFYRALRNKAFSETSKDGKRYFKGVQIANEFMPAEDPDSIPFK